MLEEKIETLTKEVVKLRQAIEAQASGSAAPAPAAKDKPAAKAPTKAPKEAPAEPKHSLDEVGALLRKAAKEVDKSAVQRYIKALGCADLAELLTKPALFDDAFAFAETMFGAGDDDSDTDEDI